MPVHVLFMPDRITTLAQPGELLLDVATRAGIKIPTGCLMGACYACRVQIEGQELPVKACIETVPAAPSMIVNRPLPKNQN
jgi:ferredoxin